mmetsp:Transcript_4429/g.8605  ORF Transcript_4429/g.8605 Transcript_4429/m.8605 type:complete len:142 (+) Transcript_4429:1234-1659(+)
MIKRENFYPFAIKKKRIGNDQKRKLALSMHYESFYCRPLEEVQNDVKVLQNPTELTKELLPLEEMHNGVKILQNPTEMTKELFSLEEVQNNVKILQNPTELTKDLLPFDLSNITLPYFAVLFLLIPYFLYSKRSYSHKKTR